MPSRNAYLSEHLVPTLLGLAYVPIVETSFLELEVSFLDFFTLNISRYFLDFAL